MPYEPEEDEDAIPVEPVVSGVLGDFVMPDALWGDRVQLPSGESTVWWQVGGPEVEIVERNGQASFQAPKLLVSEELVFEYTTIRNGQVVTETVSVAVQPVETIERPIGYVLDDWEDEADKGVDDDQGEDGGRSNVLVALLGSFFSMVRINAADDKR